MTTLIEKSRSGTYSDTSENRRKHRVGQKYGSEKKEEEKPEKTDPNKMSPEQQLEAINKVIAAVNEGKLKLPPEEINTLVAKKTMAEEAVKQAKGEKKPEEKEEEIKETSNEEAEVYTRIKFDAVPNSGKVNLKKYLSEKVRQGVDEKWSNIKNIPTDNLKKMEKGLVNDLNKNFEAIKKSQRAELLYSIMKVKGELEKRGKESQKKE